MREPGRGLLLASLVLLLTAVWLDPPGSFLAEPDEPRYAEIPREMLATGDFVVPRLNGVPYFEKPPLLYWANAGSFALLGETPFAARLPTRLAGLGTTLLLLFGVRRMWGAREGNFAAVFFLMSPLPFTFSRLNLTDGVLTFFFTGTLFAGYETIRAREKIRGSAAILSAITGVFAAGAFLSKGLVGIVLPGGILLFWCLATRRTRAVSSLLFGPALPIFLLLVTPWLWLAERRNPGFLQFFFIHEQFQRFATPVANRPGPIYYFVLVLVAGFLPGLVFFLRGLAPIRRDQLEALFFVMWFAVVFLFFSASHSKLSPYLFPAFPPAAALAARALARDGPSGRGWAVAASSCGLLPLAAAAIPGVRAATAAAGAWPIAAAGAASLLTGAAVCISVRRRPESALASLAIGWAGLYLALALIWPRMPLARDIHDLALQAKAAAGTSHGRVVSYRTYVQGFPWNLKSIVPLVDHTGELEAWWLPEGRRHEIFWSREEFWNRWRSGERLVVVLRSRDAGDFDTAVPPATLLAERGKHRVVANWAAGP
ncbi:MAG: phospholipid carrier-dependent glycosyltransferase [Acidobacteriota bacterium]